MLIGYILDVLGGQRVSASYVSVIDSEPDKAVAGYANSPLKDGFAFLF